MKSLWLRCGVVLAVCVVLAGGYVQAQERSAQEVIQGHAEQLLFSGTLTIGDAPIAAIRLIPELYERREFQPAWTNSDNIDALVRRIRNIDQEGLDPDDYNLDDIEAFVARLKQSPGDPQLRGSLDVLLTDGLARLAYQLRFGKVNPEDLDPNWNFNRDLGGVDPADLIQAAVSATSLDRFIDDSLPRVPGYESLKTALATYRGIQESGGWPEVPTGRVLKPGMESDRVATLRQRLTRTGDLTETSSATPDLFDDTVKNAVVAFQRRHGLDADGVAGKRTLDAMNVPVEKRIDQIRASLERARWVLKDVQGDFIVTNVASFQVYYLRDRQIVFRARAQVGKPYRKTPVFKADMTYLVFNPTWTVPPTILRKDVLPAIQKNVGYLQKKNMVVLNRAGKTVNPDSVEWSKYTGGNLPYAIRQEPGPNNTLGRVKFIFPNDHFVFLHDTTSRGLFDRSERSFSSGCIRVDRPLELAEMLLDDSEKWNQEGIAKTLDSKKTKTVFLPEPVTVLLLYWTAYVDPEDGKVHFRKDIYDRDQNVIDGLNAEFRISAPRGVPDYLRDK